jgi:magnesium chelatase family protein
MPLAVIRSRSLDGLAAPEVTVEVHLANGLPSFTLVGLAETEVKEARDAQENKSCMDAHWECVSRKIPEVPVEIAF